MPEQETPPVDPQAGDAENPQPLAGATTTTDPQAGESPPESISLDEARKLRSEAANLRKRLKELDAAHNELKTFKEQTEASRLSDTEKQAFAQKKLEQQLAEHQSSNSELLRQLQETRIDREVVRQASKLNIIDVDAASRLIDGSRIDYDENGQPTNIPDLLKDLVKQRPWLAGKGQLPSSGGATNPSRSQTSGPQEITKEYVAQIMKGGPQAWAALSEQEQLRISQFVRGGGTIIRR
jgi:FKBP-type peptidyl-prolyl cis-trans isomerase